MTAPVDVRRFPYMPLYMERLRRSKAWLRCKRRPELAFYLMNLWMHAFHCVPAGSIESDDDVLADAAMCDPHAWEAIRSEVLRGWEERDGRLFHPVVIEVAEEAWGKVKANQKRTEAAREARGQMKLDLPDDPISVTGPVTGEEEKRREGKGTEDPPAAHSTTPREPGRGGGGVSLEMRLREAAGLTDVPASALRKTQPIERLIAEGYSLEGAVLPALRAAAAEGSAKDARSWAYFVDPIRRWSAPVLVASPVSQVSEWVARDSPEGTAWDAHERAGGRAVAWIEGRAGIGRAMPSRWPPGHEPAATAA